MSNRILDTTDTVVKWTKDFFVPSKALLATPPSWADLTAYAHNNARIQGKPALRALSVAWLYTVALPAAAKARFREWVLSRPARAVLFLGVADLFIRTTPMGHWLAWLIRGWFHVLAVVFLP